VIGAAVVLFSRPLTTEVALWTLFLAVLALAVLELVQRPVPAVPMSAAAETGEQARESFRDAHERGPAAFG
jgi:hypothetical protein